VKLLYQRSDLRMTSILNSIFISPLSADLESPAPISIIGRPVPALAPLD